MVSPYEPVPDSHAENEHPATEPAHPRTLETGGSLAESNAPIPIVGRPRIPTPLLVAAVALVWAVALGLLVFFALSWRNGPMEVVPLG